MQDEKEEYHKFDEKRVYEKDEPRVPPQVLQAPDVAQVPRKGWGFWKVLASLIVATFVLNHIGLDIDLSCGKGSFGNRAPALRCYGGYLNDGLSQAGSREPKEIIEVSFPFVPKASYGKPVYSHVLINDTFDSHGHPSSKKFTAPKDIEYNKVVLTLNTSVSGVQFDRLAHLYVGGAEIWRTSTVEPGKKHVFSSFKKDVSQYVHLFQKNTEVLFQLDNLVTGNLTGAFHVQLYADFYLSERVHSESDSDAGYPHVMGSNSSYLDEKYKYFDTRKAADNVYPLVKENGTFTPPIKYLPHDKFSVILPKVSYNTTRLKLAVFASGFSQEEFWYSNVLDKYTDRFEKEGTTFLGHGPLRFVNVWVDGKKIASQTPQPFVFTGGISPALWDSVVPVDAFDLHSIDVDVSGLLPLLWDSKDHELRILVDNGLDEVDGKCSGVGSDWVISANLLTYENAEVELSSGHVILIDDLKRAHSFGVSVPYTATMQQIVDGIFEAEISANLVYTLKNGDVLNNTLTSYTKGEVSNVQFYRRLGESAKIVHVGHSLKSFSLVDNVEHEVIHRTDLSFSYPLTLIESEVRVENGLDLDVMLVNGKKTKLAINRKTVMDESNFQNGTSTFHLRENGNYGVGSLDTKFKSIVSGPTRNFVYKRHVKASDGEVTSDESSFKEHEKDEGGNRRKHKCGEKKKGHLMGWASS